MYRLIISILLLVTVAVTGCTPFRQTMNEVRLPPHIILKSGYSLVPLNEPGWLIGYEDSERLVLGRPGSDPDENAIIRSFTKLVPQFKTEDEFIGFSKSVLVAEGSARHKILSMETTPLTLKGQSCTETDTVLEDHGAVKHTSRTEMMILESYELLCKHPNTSVGIVIAYSHRYYPGHKDPDSAKKARELFDSIGFYDF
jgi:hypothetical protein